MQAHSDRGTREEEPVDHFDGSIAAEAVAEA